MQTFRDYVKEKYLDSEFDLYRNLAENVVEDDNFPTTPKKSALKRYVRLEAGYGGHYACMAIDDMWTEYERDVLPKRTPDKRKTADEIRQEMADDIISFIEDYRTGLNDDLLDKITDHVEMLVQGRKEREA